MIDRRSRGSFAKKEKEREKLVDGIEDPKSEITKNEGRSGPSSGEPWRSGGNSQEGGEGEQ